MSKLLSQHTTHVHTAPALNPQHTRTAILKKAAAGLLGLIQTVYDNWAVQYALMLKAFICQKRAGRSGQNC